MTVKALVNITSRTLVLLSIWLTGLMEWIVVLSLWEWLLKLLGT